MWTWKWLGWTFELALGWQSKPAPVLFDTWPLRFHAVLWNQVRGALTTCTSHLGLLHPFWLTLWKCRKPALQLRKWSLWPCEPPCCRSGTTRRLDPRWWRMTKGYCKYNRVGMICNCDSKHLGGARAQVTASGADAAVVWGTWGMDPAMCFISHSHR